MSPPRSTAPRIRTSTRLLARLFLALSCLAAAATPVEARESAATDPVADLKRRANEAASRLTEARSEHARLQAEVAELERQLSTLEDRMAVIRQTTTRGAAALYMHDSIVDSMAGLGDGDALLRAARRTRLVGTVNELAGVSVRELDSAARQMREQRQTVADRRDGQKRALAEIAGERRDVELKLAALARAQRQQARQRPSRSAPARPAPAPVATPAESPPEAPVVRPPAVPGAFICPINGPVAFSDDFGGRRNHKGNDLMNPRGTENVAVVNGTIDSRPWRGGGIVVFLRGDDGHLYIYMHLLRIVGPYPRRVVQGEVVGLTGATGNASAYHTHFEFHPGGGAAVNPYPLVKAHC